MYSPTNRTVEPMVLGGTPSPSAHEPKSPGNRSFLPQYLFGASSFGGEPKPGVSAPTSPVGPPTSPKDVTSNFSSLLDVVSPFDTSLRSSTAISSSRPAGPPIRSLVDDDDDVDESEFIGRTPGSVLSSSRFQSPASFSSCQPFNVSGLSTAGDISRNRDLFAETCITVFGFPPQSFDFILHEFSQFGNVLNYEMASQGNWIHIMYETKIQARRALSKNGKLFGNLKIGVSPCSDAVVLRKFRSTGMSHSQRVLPSSVSLPVSESTSGAHRPDFDGSLSIGAPDRSRAVHDVGETRNLRHSKADMRTLSTSYFAGAAAKDTQKEAEESSLFGKLYNYIFGW